MILKPKKYAVHLLVWSMLFLLPLLISERESTINLRNLTHNWLPLVEGGVIFYLNYLVLIDKFIFNKRRFVVFILINVFITLIFRFDMHTIQILLGQENQEFVNKGAEHIDNRHSGTFTFIKSLLGLVMPVAFALAVKSMDLWRKLELRKKEIENTQLHSELTNLKYQLQPHFFFNSLNNIYSFVDDSPEIAKQAIHNLSKLMRYLLYETNGEKVDLAVEINFVKKFIQLMEIRQANDVITNCIFPDVEPGNYTIAPLLLIPIIENAFKHGISATHISKINFDLSVAENRLILKTSNTNFPKNQTDTSGSGIGIENLKKRLALLYPEKHNFTAEVNEGMFCLNLSIDLT